MASRLTDYKIVAGGVSAEYFADTIADIPDLPTTNSTNVSSKYGGLIPSIGSTCSCSDYNGSFEVLVLTSNGWEVM